MMNYNDWYVGMQVVCIAGPVEGETGPHPIIGQICTISWIGIQGNDVVCIDLVEEPSPESSQYYRGYVADGFRPLEDTKQAISCFIEILNNPKRKIVENV